MSERPPSPRRKPVPRVEAEQYLRLMLISFAGSVLALRAYLAATGYPQVGNETLHISHALWGGLLLFVASLVPLLVTNRWAYPWSAVLSGLGVGLFVDEVGKFITQDNDYFFPAAAPIAYGLFVMAVLLYVRFTNTRPRTARAELHNVLDELKDELDNRLDRRQREALCARLSAARDLAADAGDDDAERLASALLDFEQRLQVDPPARPGRLNRLRRALDRAATRWLSERRLRRIVIVGLVVLGLAALSDLTVIVAVSVDAALGSQSRTTTVINHFARIDIDTTSGVALLLTRAGLDVLVGSALIMAAVLMAKGARRRAVQVAQVSLLVSLTVVNLLVFYFVQFVAAVGAIAQYALLSAVRRYQDHHLDDSQESDEPDDRDPTADETSADVDGDLPAEV